MVNFNKIKRVGLGFGFGGAFSKESKYNLNHIGKHVFRSDIKNRKKLGRFQNERLFY